MRLCKFGTGLPTNAGSISENLRHLEYSVRVLRETARRFVLPDRFQENRTASAMSKADVTVGVGIPDRETRFVQIFRGGETTAKFLFSISTLSARTRRTWIAQNIDRTARIGSVSSKSK